MDSKENINIVTGISLEIKEQKLEVRSKTISQKQNN